MSENKTNQKNGHLEKQKSYSERFTNEVMKEYSGFRGEIIKFNQTQKRLCGHLFVKIDNALKTQESKRIEDNKQITPFNWNNINIDKLAVDVVHRIELGLDALIDNHISPIPYWNKAKKKYDIDLRIGYAGKDYYRRKHSQDPPINIIYELVYKNDKFRVIKKSFGNDTENYEFDIPNPFDRGEIIGGFGYIMFKDSTRNKVVLVSEADFKKSESLAKSDAFWKKFPIEMRFKTLVTRTTDKLQIDPDKVNESFYAVEESDKEEMIDLDSSQTKENDEEIDIKDDDYSVEDMEDEQDDIILEDAEGFEDDNEIQLGF